MLAKVANQLEMNNHLLLSHGESKDNGRARNYIMANALEALIGAIYLDQGHDKSKEFIEREIIKEIARKLLNKNFIKILRVNFKKKLKKELELHLLIR